MGNVKTVLEILRVYVYGFVNAAGGTVTVQPCFL